VREDGLLTVSLLPLDSMMALRVFRQPDSGTPAPEASPDSTIVPEIPTETPTLTLTEVPTQTPLLVQTNTPRP
jgi:hypothetical protein